MWTGTLGAWHCWEPNIGLTQCKCYLPLGEEMPSLTGSAWRGAGAGAWSLGPARLLINSICLIKRISAGGDEADGWDVTEKPA